METKQTRFERVMLIDDNSIDLFVASRVMAKNNFAGQTLQFNAAGDALQYLRVNSANPSALPQIILVDIYMPVMSGFGFMEAYRELPDSVRNGTMVYIVSSSIDETDIARAGADRNITAFQEKPVTAAFLNAIN
ncbi:MAG TPA: response regulator [Flavobacterium sp.]|jgi:CheY-like chemotaxis protein